MIHIYPYLAITGRQNFVCLRLHSFAILLVVILVVVSDAEVGIGLLQRIVRTEQWFAVADWGIIARILPGDTQIGG